VISNHKIITNSNEMAAQIGLRSAFWGNFIDRLWAASLCIWAVFALWRCIRVPAEPFVLLLLVISKLNHKIIATIKQRNGLRLAWKAQILEAISLLFLIRRCNSAHILWYPPIKNVVLVKWITFAKMEIPPPWGSKFPFRQIFLLPGQTAI